MTGQHQTFAEGASINRPPLFTGNNYAFWKVRIQIFMESIDSEIWETITNGHFVPIWNVEDKRRFQLDVKARNIISSALTVDKFSRITTCKNAHEMWEMLRVTHKGIDDVKRARRNTLVQEYEMTWQPKVTIISESRNLNTMLMVALFGKLRKHELDLGRLNEDEEKGKKKTLSFKSEISKSKYLNEGEDSDEDKEVLGLFVKKFNKFMKSKGRRRFKGKKKEKSRNLHQIIVEDCPIPKKGEERGQKKLFKKKKVYIAWEEDNDSTTSSSDSDEQANICLMANDDISRSQMSSISKKSMWYLNSGCSRHMSSDIKKLTNFHKKEQGYVTYGDNIKGMILGIGDIGSAKTLMIKDVLFVEGNPKQSSKIDQTFKPAKLAPQENSESLITTGYHLTMLMEKSQKGNKLDEDANITKNKARLVTKDYYQEEGIDYDETYTRVSRLEAIHLLLAYASIMKFKLYQMDVKSAFLNGYLKEDVFVEEPPAIERRYASSQTKYCREILKKFEMHKAKEASNPMATSCYLNKDGLGTPENKIMYSGMIGSLLYLSASRLDIMQIVCVCARYHPTPEESDLIAVKLILKYLKGTISFGLWYPCGAEPSLVEFANADYGGCKIDRKSTSATCHLLSSSLDFDIYLDHIPLKCDNTSAINLTKNPIMHSRTKHIKIMHHFLRDHIQKGDCEIEYVDTKHQVADIFTKALPKKGYMDPRNSLRILFAHFSHPRSRANNLSGWISDEEKHREFIVKGVDIILDDHIWSIVAQLQLDEDKSPLRHSVVDDDDQEMDDIKDEARPFASASHSYSLENLSRQLSDMSVLQASRHEEICSLIRGLNDGVHALEGLAQPLDVDDSDENVLRKLLFIVPLLGLVKGVARVSKEKLANRWSIAGEVLFKLNKMFVGPFQAPPSQVRLEFKELLATSPNQF
ncbi:hypothetical protein V8G54_005995 [Vigna mungo]|uniref:Uncharacterized protein n=1 Tax=Vigna mungo TaxID=3915 RepID=A0AAQ3NZN0_VIGMU